ncbi:hypothetical protein XENTR_v10003934 [Xenopus tropicalis]|nr:hypothetical protein XENTR_v10003934 [Xenopus tropicalis]
MANGLQLLVLSISQILSDRHQRGHIHGPISLIQVNALLLNRKMSQPWQAKASAIHILLCREGRHGHRLSYTLVHHCLF